MTLFIATIGAVVITLVLAIALAWENSGSRNLALAVGALFAAVVLFVVEFPFEFKAERDRDFVSTDFTIDRETPFIRHWDYGRGGSIGAAWRMPSEIAASDWLVAHDRAAFNGDPAKLTEHFAMFSILAFFAYHENDWQMKRTTYRGSAAGTVYTAEPQSPPNECETIDGRTLRATLWAANNPFADVPILSGRTLCLPPHTSLAITGSTLVLDNPFVRLAFAVRDSGSASFVKPRTGDAPRLKDGKPRYATLLTGVTISTLYYGLRAHHRDADKYRAWAARLIEGLTEWFAEDDLPRKT